MKQESTEVPGGKLLIYDDGLYGFSLHGTVSEDVFPDRESAEDAMWQMLEFISSEHEGDCDVDDNGTGFRKMRKWD